MNWFAIETDILKILSFASNEILCWNAIYEIQYYLQIIQAHTVNGFAWNNEFMQIAWLNLYEFHKIPCAWETLKLFNTFSVILLICSSLKRQFLILVFCWVIQLVSTWMRLCFSSVLGEIGDQFQSPMILLNIFSID